MAIKVQDHLGNRFKSIREMALFHGKDPTKVAINLRKGMTPEEALFHKNNQHYKPVKDHLGNYYINVTERRSVFGYEGRWNDEKDYIYTVGIMFIWLYSIGLHRYI